MRAPAFQFYPSDYLSSQRVQMMSLEEEGAYIRLLCYCWIHGSIPADVDQMERLIGKVGSGALSASVKEMFSTDPNNPSRLRHPRLDAERDRQAEWRQKCVIAGRKGGRPPQKERVSLTNHKGLENPSLCHPLTNPEGVVKLNETSSSSSSLEEEVGKEGSEERPLKWPKEEEVVRHGKTFFPPADEEFCLWWFDSNDGAGWVDKDKRPIVNWKSAMASAWRGAQHRRHEMDYRRKQSRPPAKREPIPDTIELMEVRPAMEIYRERQREREEREANL